jgi:hypothetical protein
MSRWEPHLDLMRLLEALADEIAAATDYDVRQACSEGRCTAAMVQEVRELIGTVSGDLEAPGIDADVDPQHKRVELERSVHPGNGTESGRTCHRRH